MSSPSLAIRSVLGACPDFQGKDECCSAMCEWPKFTTQPQILQRFFMSTVLVQVPFLNWVFFFVLALQWNPFTPCLGENVKLFCQGSWMQGKLGWTFPCPELACTVCWSGFVSCCHHGVPAQPAWGAVSVARPEPSAPSLPLPSCPGDTGMSPWFHGLLRGCCGVFTSHPVLWAVLFRSGKRSFLVPGGEFPMWKCTLSQAGPALLLAMGACTVPLSPSPSQSSGGPTLTSALLKRVHQWISQVLLRQDSPGTWITWLPWSLLFCSDVLYNGLFRFTRFTGPLATGEVSFPESEQSKPVPVD